MALQSQTTGTPAVVSESTEISGVYVQGVVAGLIGAATIALWFFILDLYNGRPFYTPNVLGAALSLSEAARDPATAPTSMEHILFYSWIHVLVFCVIGGLASKLLSLAERDLHFGFGILLLFIIFEFGFVFAAMVFAEPTGGQSTRGGRDGALLLAASSDAAHLAVSETACSYQHCAA